MLKFFTLLVALATTLSVANAEHHNTATIADKNGCKVYNPMPQKDESISWSGKCLNGFAHGKGTLKWEISGKVKEVYTGDMANGWAEGDGVLTSEEGTQYEGSWVRSRQHGRGVQINPDDSAYDGEWREGRPHGYGRFRTPTGQTWEGEWHNGKPLQEDNGRRI